MITLQNLALEAQVNGCCARVLGRRVADIYAVLYPDHHPMTGLQWYRYGDIASLDGKDEEAKTAHLRAYEALRISFGERHHFVRSLQDMYQF